MIIATAYREEELLSALRSLEAQTVRPYEVIVVDGAAAPGAEQQLAAVCPFLDLDLRYTRWTPPSAAVQRNIGAGLARADVLLFMDDDAYLEPDCLEKVIAVFAEDRDGLVGGVGVLIRNQLCPPPSPRAKAWLDFLADAKAPSYSGKVIGPAVNIGPEPRADGQVVQVEWLSSTCAAYRKDAFLAEKFCQNFEGYSFMEDVDLSVRVGQTWTLLVHTGAFIYHDSQPSRFKKPYAKARMAVRNRYHVMTESMQRRSWKHHAKFFVYIYLSWVLNIVRTRHLRDLEERCLELAGIAVGTCGIARAVYRNLVK